MVRIRERRAEYFKVMLVSRLTDFGEDQELK